MIHCDTAYYVFDIPTMQERVSYLRSLLGPDIRLAYAVKANPFLAKAGAACCDRLELCSPGEAELCFRQGIPGDRMVISGVYKTPAFIEQLAADNTPCIYTVESMQQFRLLQALSERSAAPLPLLLRLTNDSQFGINRAEIEAIVANRAAYPGLELLGIQYFSGTQKKSLKKLKRELTMLDSLLLELENQYGFRARELEYGPGFPVAYFRDEALDERELIGGLRELIGQMTARPEITLELGRSIAACCGRYYTHVVDQKCNSGQNYLLVDGGMHQLVYFGQYMGMKHPFVTVPGKEEAPIDAEWNVCGSLCSMNDILAKQLPLPAVAVGDLLCFHNAGAYCMTEGMALFLTRELPGIYLTDTDGVCRCVRKPTEACELNLAQAMDL